MIQKTAAIGNWWLAASSRQCTNSYITSHAEFFGENHPGDSGPLQPRFGTLWLLAFPKTKITFEREEISDHQWDSGKYDRTANDNWENCVTSQGAYLEQDWGIIVLCTMFLVSSSVNVFLAGVAQRVERQPENQKDANSILSQGTFLGGAGQILVGGMWEATKWCFSPLFLPPFPLPPL